MANSSITRPQKRSGNGTRVVLPVEDKYSKSTTSLLPALRRIPVHLNHLEAVDVSDGTSFMYLCISVCEVNSSLAHQLSRNLTLTVISNCLNAFPPPLLCVLWTWRSASWFLVETLRPCSSCVRSFRDTCSQIKTVIPRWEAEQTTVYCLDKLLIVIFKQAQYDKRHIHPVKKVKVFVHSEQL